MKTNTDRLKNKSVRVMNTKNTVKSKNWKNYFSSIQQIMQRDLFTVLESDVIDLVANIMELRNIRHVPVENDEGLLVGLVSSKQLVKHYYQTINYPPKNLLVKEIMSEKYISVPPETKIVKAIQLMKDNEVSCLTVVKNKRLVGLVTEYDFVKIAAILLQELDSDIPVRRK